jgi:hypothetical protein
MGADHVGAVAPGQASGPVFDYYRLTLFVCALTPGSGALHQLAMTGEISREIRSDLEVAYELLPELAARGSQRLMGTASGDGTRANAGLASAG